MELLNSGAGIHTTKSESGDHTFNHYTSCQGGEKKNIFFKHSEIIRNIETQPQVSTLK